MAAMDRVERTAQGERKFLIGGSASRAISTWIVTLPKTALLAAIAMSPSFAWLFLTDGFQKAGREPFEAVVDLLLQTACSGILSGMVIYVAFKRLMREPSSIGTAVATGMRRFVPLFVVGLITGVLAALPLVGILLVDIDGENAERAVMLAGLAGFAVIATTVIVTMMFSAAAGAIVVESLGPLAAMKRSLVLTKGCRFKIFICLILVGIIVAIVGALLLMIGGASLADLADLSVATSILITVLTTPLSSTLSAVIYHDLRATKEGVDVAELSRVFN